MPNTTVQTNKQFTINYRDVLRGVVVAVLTAALTALLDGLQVNGLNLDWKSIGIIGLTAGVSYLVKNVFTPTEIVVVNPTKEAVNQVKEGAAVQVGGETVARKEV